MAAQPSALYSLAFSELWERLSYYGTQTILVLYLTKVFLLPDSQSYSFYGIYATFAFAMPVLGGILADRYLGARQALVIGAVLLIVSNLLLASSKLLLIDFGLALNICGIGLYKSNSTSLVGVLYQSRDPRREAGFTLFYIAMNIGAMLGPLLYGITTKIGSWRIGFIITAIGILSGLIIFLRQPSTQFVTLASIKQPFSIKLLAYFILLVSFSTISVTFFYPGILGTLLLILLVVIVSGLFLWCKKLSVAERHHLYGLYILLLFVIIFFAASLQVSSSINLFIERDVNRSVFGWNIPTLFFSSLYPLAVIFLAPLFAFIWRYLTKQKKILSIAMKVAIGLCFATIGFLCFFMASISSANLFKHAALIWIVIANFCLGAGEVCLIPTLLNAISCFAPAKLQSTMIGILFLFIAFAGYLSGQLAKLTDYMAGHQLFAHLTSTIVYNYFFAGISLSTFIATITLFILAPFIKKRLKLAI